LSVLLLVSMAAIARLVTARKHSDVSLAQNAPTAPAAFEPFWKPFAFGPEEPWVVFSKASFVGRPETGLRNLTCGTSRRWREMHVNTYVLASGYSSPGYFTVSVNMVLWLNEPEVPVKVRV
jgi:hypothetical protein